MRDVLRLKRNFLNLAAKKIGLLLAVAVLLLLFVSLQGQWSQSYAAEADLKQKTATAYPETPVEYVEVKTIPLYEVFKTKEKWYATAYQATVKDLESTESPSKLCFSHDSIRNCFEAKTEHSNTLYNFQYVKKLSLVPLLKNKEPQNAILFVTEFHVEGGSGSLLLVTLWNYRAETKEFVNILPKVLITEQGEYRLFTKKEGLEGILVTADYIWGEGETHFSRHRYKIKIYKFKDSSKPLFLYKEYTTKSKYKSLDEIDADEINVIKPELKEIKKILRGGKYDSN